MSSGTPSASATSRLRLAGRSRTSARCSRRAGADFSHVAELTYYLVDLDDFSTLDRVRRDYLIGPPYPASTAVEVPASSTASWLLEVSAIAVLPG